MPEHVDPVKAVLASLGAIAHHGFMQSRPEEGDCVFHVGLGVLGQLSSCIYQAAEANVLSCDLSP